MPRLESSWKKDAAADGAAGAGVAAGAAAGAEGTATLADLLLLYPAGFGITVATGFVVLVLAVAGFGGEAGFFTAVLSLDVPLLGVLPSSSRKLMLSSLQSPAHSTKMRHAPWTTALQ